MWLPDRRFFLTGLAVSLTGCGFVPAYGPAGGAQVLQGRVALAEPSDRAGFQLNERLEHRLGRAGAADFQLAVTVKTESQGLAYTTDGQITRYNLIGRADYTLRDSAGGVLTHGSVDSFTGYSTTGSTVATRASEKDAEARLMVILADRITDRLIIAAQEFA